MRCCVWVALLAVSAAGGWYFERWLAAPGAFLAEKTAQCAIRVPPSQNGGVGFAAGSPEGLWMAQVKKATAADFPGLLDEWKVLFPEGDDGLTGRPEHALRWIFAMWLVADADDALRIISDSNWDPDCKYGSCPGEALARLMPGKAVELLGGPQCGELDEFFAGEVAHELAQSHPRFYLKLDPDGTFHITSKLLVLGSSGFPGDIVDPDDWELAIGNLTKTDTLAAAKACLKAGSDRGNIMRTLQTVARAWKTSDPPLAEWVNGIADPNLRNFAIHAGLCVLAEKDPKAALAELYAANPKDGQGFDTPRIILAELAKQDFVAALKLVKDVEGSFEKVKPALSADPFADPFAGSFSEDHTGKPFSRYAASGDELESDSVRRAVLGAGVENLPDDPAQLMAAMHKLCAEAGAGDVAWQRGIEGDAIRVKSARWSVDACLAAAGQWAAELDLTEGDATLRTLAYRMAQVDAEQALAALQRFPEQARSFLAGELIKQLPTADSDQRITLASQLPATEWTPELGTAVARDADHLAPIIAALPADSAGDARREFVRSWAEQDPDATVQWLESLPEDRATELMTGELANTWVSYDADAATAWAEGLPAGPARDHAAQRISYRFSIAQGQCADAWHWADAISDSKVRAVAYEYVAIYWKTNAPDEFRAAHDQVRKDAGLPPYPNPAGD